MWYTIKNLTGCISSINIYYFDISISISHPYPSVSRDDLISSWGEKSPPSVNTLKSKVFTHTTMNALDKQMRLGCYTESSSPVNSLEGPRSLCRVRWLWIWPSGEFTCSWRDVRYSWLKIENLYDTYQLGWPHNTHHFVHWRSKFGMTLHKRSLLSYVNRGQHSVCHIK